MDWLIPPWAFVDSIGVDSVILLLLAVVVLRTWRDDSTTAGALKATKESFALAHAHIERMDETLASAYEQNRQLIEEIKASSSIRTSLLLEMEKADQHRAAMAQRLATMSEELRQVRKENVKLKEEISRLSGLVERRAS